MKRKIVRLALARCGNSPSLISDNLLEGSLLSSSLFKETMDVNHLIANEIIL